MKILLISTGGTIAGNVAGRGGAEHADGKTMSGLLDKVIASVSDKWNVNITVDATKIIDIDSSDVQPGLWTDIAQCIYDNYDNYQGFVVTHGTNTMGYTSAALSFAFGNPSKPIVLTGSQIPQEDPGSDAQINLDNALRIAAYPSEYATISGVVVVFGSHLITGVRAKKATEFDLDAFQTFSAGGLGRIGRIFDVSADNLGRHQRYLSAERPVAIRQKDLLFKPDFNMAGIASLSEFPGLSAQSLIAAAEAWGDGGTPLQGVIFRSFGAGDVSEHRLPFFEYLKERRIPVMVTTQAPNGQATFTVNSPGVHLAENDLAIPAYDMSIESMTVKLGWLLAQDLSYEDIKRLMVTDLRGEVTIARELDWM